jgi:hypothetical protein
LGKNERGLLTALWDLDLDFRVELDKKLDFTPERAVLIFLVAVLYLSLKNLSIKFFFSKIKFGIR